MTLANSMKLRALLLENGDRIELTQSEAAVVRAALDDAQFFSPQQASEMLGVSRPMIVRWINEGLLEDVPTGTHHRITGGSLFALKSARLSASRFAIAQVNAAETDSEVAQRLAPIKTRVQELIAKRDALA